MNDIIEAIKNNQSFVISSHKSPDGDSIGSCIALGLALKRLNKTVTYVMEYAPEKFRFLNEITNFNDHYTSLQNYDVGLFLDCSNIEHLHNSSLLDNCDMSINIDHHISNTKYGNLNFIDTCASATGEVIFELINKLNVPLEKEMSAALYTAIVTDTGNFKYSNVTSRTHYIVSKLYEVPNSYSDINTIIFDEHSYEKIKLIGKGLSNLYITKDNKVSIILLTLDDLRNISESVDLEGIINYARDIRGVEVAVFIKETNKNTFRVSFRSNTNFDVSRLAAYYGGGGHMKASGCTIEGITSDQIIKDIIDQIEKDLK
ncbi:bifunctional oligoribonuclease/PAP phosphatase NrnA [Alkalibaculum sp. M08DMB]|uniref:Bifunctional oligoribonuclease/PAP phosphatase NrnA n=1 Tax=Alkalibaculum sporogenes TaxID=2655001 RepID=A0A6A7K937_9FIRM|nr:bifunctional oligoribonuclease/PAP phosphatase NrnA [Alkalibaculum sporogenes]MPW25831.1 bifunctional oligoribonuclease/PAP phosphatase NrnA [Alkalibaculum sporogenes]